jgi:hypothetical protein
VTAEARGGLEIMRAYVAGQAALGYPAFDPGPRPDDVILATFPKSGSTWTSYLLHQIRSGADDDFDDIKNEVVDITPGHWDPARQPFAEPQRFQPRTYKTHGSYALCPKGAAYVYVSRDPRDILWSLYHFIHDLLAIPEWVPLRGAPNMLWLHYEDLVEHTEPALRLLAAFMRVPLDARLMERLLEHGSMAHMRSIAARINPSPDNYVGRLVAGFGELTRGYARQMKFGKLRRGVPGDGSAGLPRELADELDREWRSRITPRLGYTDYGAMRAACASF